MMNENEIGKIIVDAAVAVHRKLAPGLLESVYEGWNSSPFIPLIEGDRERSRDIP
ncbi:MAG: hypothetical protein NG747_02185 [Candidatus Brocadia sp.]|nr:hypothetical protein [Candidatus Brocadia sp.]